MIRLSIKPRNQSQEALDMLGTAIVTLDVSSADGFGLPQIESTVDSLKGSISLKVLTIPHDKYGHIVDEDRHSGATLLHCVQAWNEFGAYVVTVEEGQEFIVNREESLPPGAIP